MLHEKIFPIDNNFTTFPAIIKNTTILQLE